MRISNFKNLKHSSGYRATLNEEEESFAIAWDIIKTEVTKLTNEGWELDKKGYRQKAGLKYRAGNHYFYLVHYVITLKNYLTSIGRNDQKCNGKYLEDKFRISCVEDNLQCLSVKYGANYVTVWKRLLEAFYIDRSSKDCDPGCCPGIGDMIIEDSDDCNAFIIGDCK